MGAKHYWIFQANEDEYAIDRALASGDQLSWSVRQHANEIGVGDIAFLWKSGSDGGVRAIASVESSPGQHLDGTAYFVKEFDPTEPRVLIKVRKQVVIPRSLVKADTRLAELSILRFAQSTNFVVRDGEALALFELAVMS